MFQHVEKISECLYKACTCTAREALHMSQRRMKKWYDRKAVLKQFQPGDKVMVLLPIPGFSLSPKFSGTYIVKEKLSDINYVICTPDSYRKSRVCRVNMLKAYFTRNDVSNNEAEKLCSDKLVSVGLVSVPNSSEELNVQDYDGLVLRSPQTSCRLLNSEMLSNLSSLLGQLPKNQMADIKSVICKFPSIFQDVPTQTTVLQHDIQVTTSRPIKQHAYRTNATKRTAQKEEVKYLLEHGLAKASWSPWSSPCLLVPKPDGSYRLCTDYRGN